MTIEAQAGDSPARQFTQAWQHVLATRDIFLSEREIALMERIVGSLQRAGVLPLTAPDVDKLVFEINRARLPADPQEIASAIERAHAEAKAGLHRRAEDQRLSPAASYVMRLTRALGVSKW